MEVTQLHDERKVLHDFAVDPDHSERHESPEFRHTKQRLHADGHMQCWTCGSTERLQVHHLFCEYMFQAVVNYDKLKAMAEEWDVYGYGRLLKKQPITSVDDIRNMMVLCQAHHTGVNHVDGGGGTGIHSCTPPTFFIQKVALDGANPVPQAGETFPQCEQRVRKYERRV